jgi:hypothetical protein
VTRTNLLHADQQCVALKQSVVASLTLILLNPARFTSLFGVILVILELFSVASTMEDLHRDVLLWILQTLPVRTSPRITWTRRQKWKTHSQILVPQDSHTFVLQEQGTTVSEYIVPKKGKGVVLAELGRHSHNRLSIPKPAPSDDTTKAPSSPTTGRKKSVFRRLKKRFRTRPRMVPALEPIHEEDDLPIAVHRLRTCECGRPSSNQSRGKTNSNLQHRGPLRTTNFRSPK